MKYKTRLEVEEMIKTFEVDEIMMKKPGSNIGYEERRNLELKFEVKTIVADEILELKKLKLKKLKDVENQR